MTRFEEVTRLRELEKKASPAPWYYGVHPDNCDTCEDCDPNDTGMCDNPIKPDFGPVAMISSGDVVPGIFSSVVLGEEDNPNGRTIANLRNAAPWLLEAAACFQQGDDTKIQRFLDNAELIYEQDCASDLSETEFREFKEVLIRLQKVAVIMEE